MPPRLRPIVLRSFVLFSVFLALFETPVRASEGTSKPIPPPARRYDAAAVYDPVGDQMIVFGGILGDSWESKDTWAHGSTAGAMWVSKFYPEPAPHARSGATLTYDSSRARMILFGGAYYDPDLGSMVYPNEVWVASPSGSGWTQLTTTGTPPSGRSAHVAAYDPFGDRLIIAGGTNAVTPDLGDVWELTLSGTPAWTELHTPQSLVRKRATAVIDVAGARLVLFGGTVGSTTYNETWSLALSGPTKWTKLNPAGAPPVAREGHSAVFDPATRRMIIFGGAASPYVNRMNDTWFLDLSGSPQWTRFFPPGPLPGGRAYHNAVWDPSNGRMMVFAGYLAGSPYWGNDLWALDPSVGWSQIPDMPNPGQLMSPASFCDPVRSRLVIFGGTDESGYSNALWAHPSDSNAPWTPLAPSGTPPSPRLGASFIYDAGRDRAVLFGGSDDVTSNNDVWLLDLGTNAWSLATPSGTPPPARTYHNAVYDASRNRMLIYGGAMKNDVWELVFNDPPVWNQLIPSGTPPPPRYGTSTVLDPVRDRLIVFSGGIPGFDGGVYYNDVYALSLSGSPTWTKLAPTGTAPTGRVFHSAFYDPVQDRMMTFGGGQVLGTFIGYMFNDVWELRLSGAPAWNELHPTGALPPQRARHGWGYDSVSGTLMIFGGYVISYGATDDAWVLHLGSGTTGIEPPSQSTALRLVASPNPILTRASLRFNLAVSQPVRLTVHDIEGREVAVLVNRVLEAGDHEITWEPQTQSLGSGVYFYDLMAGNARTSGRLVLLR